MSTRRNLGSLTFGLPFPCLVLLTFFCCCSQFGLACDQIPAGQTFRARLLQPVSSYSSKPGSTVRAIVIESPQCNEQSIFPDGTPIEGYVQSVHKVGLGFRHEVAELEIQFDRIDPQGGTPIEMTARVVQIDNAREQVKDGVIHGIRSTNAPQDHLSGRVGYLMTWDPDTMWILPAYHALFPVLPEPELYFPSGTDLLLKLSTPLPVSSFSTPAPPELKFAPEDLPDLDNMARSFPERTTTPKGLDADFVNLAFVGTSEQIEQAFQAAGWKRSQAMSGRVAFGEINAWMMLRNHARGPMSRQLLEGQASESSWEKGLDSIARRDHLRIWSTPETWKGQPVWLSASTHDVGASFSMRKAHFVHYVDPNVDEERERVIRDLKLAGCLASVDEVSRPDMPHFVLNATGSAMITDGVVAIVQLRDCSHPLFRNDSDGPEIAIRPRSRLVRYVRTQVLSARTLWRENAFYDAFSATRASVRGVRAAELRHREREKNEAAAVLAKATAPPKP